MAFPLDTPTITHGIQLSVAPVFLLTAIYAAVIMATTVVFGIWSDRTGKRKVFVTWSGVVGAMASLLLAVGVGVRTGEQPAACSFTPALGGSYTIAFSTQDEQGRGAG